MKKGNKKIIRSKPYSINWRTKAKRPNPVPVEAKVGILPSKVLILNNVQSEVGVLPSFPMEGISLNKQGVNILHFAGHGISNNIIITNKDISLANSLLINQSNVKTKNVTSQIVVMLGKLLGVDLTKGEPKIMEAKITEEEINQTWAKIISQENS